MDSIQSNKSSESMARLRWNILSNALQRKMSTVARSQPQMGSIRQFSTFGLINIKEKCLNSNNNNYNDNPSLVSSLSPLTSTTSKSSSLSSQKVIDEGLNNDCEGKWFEFRFSDHINDINEESVIDIRLITDRIPIHELLHSFDNTGNVCLWPSEEVLAYYCYKNRDLCSNKTVLELGGGMTCLCGLVAAAFTSAKEVILTDGNERSISNVKAIVERNAIRFDKSIVKCKQLRWGQDSDISDFLNQIDVIFCSDCLYFDDSRDLLVDTMFKLLKSSGIAIILAPTRGSSLNKFVEIAKEKFETKEIEMYDSCVWQMHNHFLNTLSADHYITDLHFPVMITLRKLNFNH